MAKAPKEIKRELLDSILAPILFVTISIIFSVLGLIQGESAKVYWMIAIASIISGLLTLLITYFIIYKKRHKRRRKRR